MAPRTITNPAPQNAAARAALQAFHCGICGKGYARQNEFAAHEASYEHNHNVRRAELRKMTTQLGAAGAQQRDKGDGLVRIQLGAAADKKKDGPVKKGGFKSAFRPVVSVDGDGAGSQGEVAAVVRVVGDGDEEDEGGPDRYDPRRPTGCGGECRSRALELRR